MMRRDGINLLRLDAKGRIWESIEKYWAGGSSYLVRAQDAFILFRREIQRENGECRGAQTYFIISVFHVEASNSAIIFYIGAGSSDCKHDVCKRATNWCSK